MRFLAFAALLSGVLSAQQASHLPLQEGRRWRLASGGTSMELTVTGKEGSSYLVNWQNPWVKVVYYFEPKGNQIILAGLDMGNGVARFGDRPVYFDFDAQQGKPWSNSLGTDVITKRGHTIKTPAGNFDNCIEIRLKDTKGSDTYWSFAPGVGFVQFGTGGRPFLLQELPEVKSVPPPTQSSRLPSRPRPAAMKKQAGAPLFYVGLDCNPVPPEGYSADSKEKRFAMGAQAGMTMAFLHPKWDEIEPKAGTFKWDEEVDFRAKLARDQNVPIMLNFRIIDGDHRTEPNGYSKWKFDDPKLAEKLRQLIRLTGPRVKGQVRWVAIGNEVDHYFERRKGEIEPFAKLLASVMDEVKTQFPDALFTVNLSSSAQGSLNSTYRPLTELSDFISYNYYPINSDFTMREPESAQGEMKSMISAAGGKPVFFQELGYSTASQLKSSPEKQKKFLEVAFDVAKQSNGQVIGINFNWMSDLPQSVVDDLGSYYRMANSGNFKAYLGTLGWFDAQGRPKPAWEVFQKMAPTARQ